jgi:uncharacterized membrane protein
MENLAKFILVAMALKVAITLFATFLLGFWLWHVCTVWHSPIVISTIFIGVCCAAWGRFMYNITGP